MRETNANVKDELVQASSFVHYHSPNEFARRRAQNRQKWGMNQLWTMLAVSLAWAGMTRAAAAADDHRMDWWREARFGMFIHWGPVSLTGKEISWSRANSNPLCPNKGETPVAVYDNLYKEFNPTNFNADEWALIAYDAGMKYVVLTAKHCDGFLLWDSKVDPYNMAATPFDRDICAELAPAARRRGLHMGWYFSPMDWRDPDCRSPIHNDRFVTKLQGELRELLSNYGQIDELWFDLDGRPTMWRPKETYNLVRSLQRGSSSTTGWKWEISTNGCTRTNCRSTVISSHRNSGSAPTTTGRHGRPA